jgi:hypothetical protein
MNNFLKKNIYKLKIHKKLKIINKKLKNHNTIFKIYDKFLKMKILNHFSKLVNNFSKNHEHFSKIMNQFLKNLERKKSWGVVVRDASLLGRNGRRIGFGQLFSKRKTSGTRLAGIRVGDSYTPTKSARTARRTPPRGCGPAH